LMLSIYLLLNFRNLRHAISKLSSQDCTDAPIGKIMILPIFNCPIY
jgi:hypothetical protein